MADGCRWIIDYKTARLPEAELPQRAASYRPQLERYARLFADDPLPVWGGDIFPMQGCLVELPLAKKPRTRRYAKGLYWPVIVLNELWACSVSRCHVDRSPLPPAGCGKRAAGRLCASSFLMMRRRYLIATKRGA